MERDPEGEELENAFAEVFREQKDSPEELFALVYQELRRLAGALMRKERADHTLQATALVHEAYVRLFEGRPFCWENRKHLFCTAARSMRRVLMDHARSHRADRRGGALRKISLDDQGLALFRDPARFIALDTALAGLAKLHPRQAQVVELHSFVGLTEEETAEVLDVSLKTVKNDWRFAKAWLKNEMGGSDDSGAPRANPGDLRCGD
jgi:RNA polymerase sigma-70 factor (ECF subfamily)